MEQPDPSGRPAYGAFGICTIDGAAWAYRIQQYIEFHGSLKTRFFSQATPQILQAALSAGHPVVLSTNLSPVGHLIFAIGMDGTNVIANDPWGNANMANWGSLPNGAGVTYTWGKVRAAWCVEVLATTDIHPPPPPPPPPHNCFGVYQITSAGLNLRSSPTINAGIITVMSNGERVVDLSGSTVSADGYNWRHIRYYDKPGYSADTYLKLLGPCSATLGALTIGGCGTSPCVNCLTQNSEVLGIAFNGTSDCNGWDDNVVQWCNYNTYGGHNISSECYGLYYGICNSTCVGKFCLTGCGDGQTCQGGQCIVTVGSVSVLAVTISLFVFLLTLTIF